MDRSGGDMSVQLLDKTRKINKLLHNNNSSKVVFNDICEVLTEILDDAQAKLLINEGVIVNNNKVDLKIYQFNFDTI